MAEFFSSPLTPPARKIQCSLQAVASQWSRTVMVSWGVGAWWFPYYGLYYPNISKYDWGFIPNYPLIHMNKPGSNQVVELFELPTIPNQPGYFE